MRQKIAFALIMGCITTGLISFTVIAFNLGFVKNFPAIWTRSWVLAYVIAVPLILIIGPVITRIVDSLFKEKNLQIINTNQVRDL